MAAVDDEVDDRFKDIDIESILSRVQRRPLTFSRRKTVLKGRCWMLGDGGAGAGVCRSGWRSVQAGVW